MKTIEVTGALEPLSDYVREAQSEPLVVTDHGAPTAVILSLANTDLETVSLSMNPEFIALIERSRTRAATQGGISPEEMKRRVLEMP